MTLSHLDLDERILIVGRAALLLVVGWILAKLAAGGFTRAMQRKLSPHHLMMGRRAIFYLLFILFITSALHEMGFKLSVLMGAAGILSVAIGFASQTSASNLISGLFLLGEGSLALGDFIQVGNTRGEVLSIDLLSVKLRTEDNLYVRLPNETLIKSEVINISRFPIRRLDVRFGVTYQADLGIVRKTLLELAANLPHCLEEPAPGMLVDQLGGSGVDLRFFVWVPKEHYASMRMHLHESVKRALDDAHIELPGGTQIIINNPGPV